MGLWTKLGLTEIERGWSGLRPSWGRFKVEVEEFELLKVRDWSHKKK